MAVVCGLIHRAHQAGPGVTLGAAQLGRVLAALADAAEYRRKEAGQWCADCAASPPEACEDHSDDLDAVQAYDALTAELRQAAGDGRTTQ